MTHRAARLLKRHLKATSRRRSRRYWWAKREAPTRFGPRRSNPGSRKRRLGRLALRASRKNVPRKSHRAKRGRRRNPSTIWTCRRCGVHTLFGALCSRCAMESYNPTRRSGSRRRRSNPSSRPKRRANPHRSVLIYDSAIVLEGLKSSAPHRKLNARYRHRFGKDVKILGNPDGTVTLKGKKPLWKMHDYKERDL